VILRRRRSHCRRLIPSASQGRRLDSDPARYSARGTITVTVNASFVAAMESGLGGRAKRFRSSWPCGGQDINRSQVRVASPCRKSVSQVRVATPVSQLPCRKSVSQVRSVKNIHNIIALPAPPLVQAAMPVPRYWHGCRPLNDGTDKPALVPQIRAHKTRDCRSQDQGNGA
jgi:hypothetical protein